MLNSVLTSSVAFKFSCQPWFWSRFLGATRTYTPVTEYFQISAHATKKLCNCVLDDLCELFPRHCSLSLFHWWQSVMRKSIWFVQPTILSKVCLSLCLLCVVVLFLCKFFLILLWWESAMKTIWFVQPKILKSLVAQKNQILVNIEISRRNIQKY